MSKSIFDNDWLSTELERFEINYDNISVNDDVVLKDAIDAVELWLGTMSYQRYVYTRQSKYKCMDATKLNECVMKAWKQCPIALRMLDVFDCITTYYELDNAMAFDALSYECQLRIAKDIADSTGNKQLLDKVINTRMSQQLIESETYTVKNDFF
jgi:hypothetical protein